MAQIIEFFGNHPFLLAALAGSLVFIIIAEVRHRGGPGAVSAAEAVRAINDNDALMLDVREAGEYKAGHIINARNLPFSRISNDIGGLIKDKSKPIIVYCKSGTQSQLACKTIQAAGYQNVRYLKSGLFGWQDANLPTEK